MYKKQLLLRPDEFLAVVEGANVDHMALLRHIAEVGEVAAKDKWGIKCGTSILVGKYLERLKLFNHYSVRTRKRIEGVLRRFFEVFGTLDPHHVTRAHAIYWIKQQGWASSTQEWVALILERVYDFGVNGGDLWWNPLENFQIHVMTALYGGGVS